MKKETFYILPNYAKCRSLGPCHVPLRNKIANLLINKSKDAKRDSKLGEKKTSRTPLKKSEVYSDTYVTLHM
jgi:hypothetical protein